MTSASTLTVAAPGQSGRLLSARRLSTSAMHATLVRILGPASSFAMAMILASALGAAGSGVFYVALTLVTALAILAKFGLETALQRFVGAERGSDRMPAVIGIYRQALKISISLAALISALCIVAAAPIARSVLDDPNQADLVRVLGLLILPYTLLGVHSAMLKALARPAWGGFFEAAAWPLLTLSLTALGLLHGALSPYAIAVIYLLASLLAAAGSYAMVRSRLPRGIRAAPMPASTLYSSCISLTGVELINYALLWLPFILLPALAGADEAGLYNVSHRLAAQLGLLMLVVASITSARFADHYRQRHLVDLRRLAGRATRTLLMFGLPATIVLLLWGEQILHIFGVEFVAAASALRILVIGQLINLATGPVGYLLAMTGQERLLRNVLLATVSLLLPMALLLIPPFGATGAAIAVSAAIVFHNLICSRLVSQRLGLPFFLAFAR